MTARLGGSQRHKKEEQGANAALNRHPHHLPEGRLPGFSVKTLGGGVRRGCLGIITLFNHLKSSLHCNAPAHMTISQAGGPPFARLTSRSL